MKQLEVLEWLSILCYMEKPTKTSTTLTLRPCKDDAERITVIHDLLIHAGTDKMTADDRRICLEALEYLCLKNSVVLPGITKQCKACHKSVTMTVEGHREHLSRCCMVGPGRPPKTEVDVQEHDDGETSERRERQEVPELRADNRDGFDGNEEAFPLLL